MTNLTTTDRVQRLLRRLQPGRRRQRSKENQGALVQAIRRAQPALCALSSSDLAERWQHLHAQVAAGASVLSTEVIVPCFALVSEAVDRVLGVSLYDEQLLAGLALARGCIAEMKTGEGKTLAATMPAALHALADRGERNSGVHVMTVNAYLAERDYRQLLPVYHELGISVGLTTSDQTTLAKRQAYDCLITYGPGYEFGFDYLRDQMQQWEREEERLGDRTRRKLRGESKDDHQPLVRGHAVGIVDEADSVMVDEADTPLVLADALREPADNADAYRAARAVARQLKVSEHYEVDPRSSRVVLSESGIAALTSAKAKFDQQRLDRPWSQYVEQALLADHLFRRDIHYVVRDDQVQIVDQHTGRIFSDRSWCEGLHQALQAKEGITITRETNAVARITRQRFLRLYQQLSGMTGTARGAEAELAEVYGLAVDFIPLHQPCRRHLLPARVFADRLAKEQAILQTIADVYARRQPLLVGTSSIETSERLANAMNQRGIPSALLNGRQDEAEASVVARAGQLGAVTIATNMAGRGTDIPLGEGVAERGGLFVLATEFQDCRRVDRQLAGRAARQGDPGSAQFFAAADDPLFRTAPRLAARIRRLAGSNGELTHDLSASIQALQAKLERQSRRQRRHRFEHDDWLWRAWD